MLATWALTFVSVMLGGLLFMVFGKDLPEPSKAAKEIFDDPSAFIFAAIITAPLIEETLCRSWMRGHKFLLAGFPAVLMIPALLGVLMHPFLHPLIKFPVLAIMGGTYAAYMMRFWATLDMADAQIRAAKTIFPWCFWASAVIFSLAHLPNYSLGDFHPVHLVLVLPQLIAGFILGFVRMHYGILVAIGFHSVFNGISVMIFMGA